MPLTKPVSSLMTVSPVVANETTTFSQILRLFSEFPVHHLPVVDANNKLIGIISTNDFMRVFKKMFELAEPVQMSAAAIDEHIRVLDIMTPNPVSVSSGQTIGEALKIFAGGKFLALPIVDNDQVIGIISAKDILNYLA